MALNTGFRDANGNTEVLITPRGSLPGEDYLDVLTDQGKLFHASDVQTTGSELNYLFKVGAKVANLFIVLSTGAKCLAVILKGATVTADGTEIASQNFDDTSINTLGFKFFRGPTYSGGTLYRNSQSGFGTNPGQAVSGGSSSRRYKLPAGSKYILKLTPSASMDIVTHIIVFEEA